jgi:hypothetical protein
MPPKLKEAIAIQEAMNNLEAISSIDLDAPGSIGIYRKTRIVTDRDEFPHGEVLWIEEEGSEVLLDVLDSSFRAVYDYLVFLSKSPQLDWKSEKGLELIKSTMAIAGDAARNMEQFLELKLGRPHPIINESNEFAEMNSYYARYFSDSKKKKKSEDAAELTEENWDKENDLFEIQIKAENPQTPSNRVIEQPEYKWDEGKKSFEIQKKAEISKPASKKVTDRPEYKAMHDFYLAQFAKDIEEDLELHNNSNHSLQDINEVRIDKDYELFYIRYEDGMPFYNLEMLQNMSLACNFESEETGFEEDPLLQIRAIQDRDASASAAQILGDCHHQIEDFYKVLKKLINNELAKSLSSLCMSLLLAKNGRNLIQNGTGKTCLQYIEDSLKFLRLGFKTTEYQKLVAYPPDKSDKMAFILLNLIHGLSKSFFNRAGGVKAESIGLLHRSARKGKEAESKDEQNLKPHSFWAHFLLEDEALRSLLSKFPSGPLMKTLDLIRTTDETAPPFDPIEQGNYPLKLFEMGEGSTRVDFLHMPAPVRQYVINKVEILDEFRGLLRSYIASDIPHKHLMINLQDKTSWKESARCNALEGIQRNAEFNKVFLLVTIPKETSFAMQSSEYISKDDATAFMDHIISRAKFIDEEGMSLPSGFKPEDYTEFAQSITPVIHKNFFDNKKKLNRLDREIFLDIFDLFYSLKLIERYEPTTVSFTSKDSLDGAAAETAKFYAFMKMLGDEFTSREDLDMFRWLVYNQALFVRERAINEAKLCKMVASLERIQKCLETNSESLLKQMTTIYKPQFLKKLNILN